MAYQAKPNQAKYNQKHAGRHNGLGLFGRHRKTILLFTILAAALAAGTGVFIYRQENTIGGNTVVAYVDGAPVTAGEYQLFVARERANVMSLYSNEQITAKDFWTTPVGGQAPVDRLQQLVFGDLIPIKTVQNLAARKGIARPFDYRQFMSQLPAVNESRQSDISAGKAVYGNAAYDDFTYYNYYQSNLKTSLTNELLSENQNISDSELQDYYQQNKQQYHIQTQVHVITAEIFPQTQAESDAGLQTLQPVKEAMAKGDDLQQLQSRFGGVAFTDLTLDDTDTQAGMMGQYQARWQTASAMQAGEIAGPLVLNGVDTVIWCLDRQDDFYRPYEEVKDQLAQDLRQQTADGVIQDAAANANVVDRGDLPRRAALAVLQPGT